MFSLFPVTNYDNNLSGLILFKCLPLTHIEYDNVLVSLPNIAAIWLCVAWETVRS